MMEQGAEQRRGTERADQSSPIEAKATPDRGANWPQLGIDRCTACAPNPDRGAPLGDAVGHVESHAHDRIADRPHLSSCCLSWIQQCTTQPNLV